MFGGAPSMLFLLAFVVGVVFCSTPSPSDGKQLKFFVFTEECFDTLVLQQNFLHADCAKQVISKALGFAIIAGSFGLKLPQMYKILSSGSVQGLAASMYYLESLGQTFNVCYNMRLQHPFSAYGESIIILVQNIVIIGMIWSMSRSNSYSLLHMSTVIAIFALSASGSWYSLPQEMVPLLVAASTATATFSRIPQIFSNLSAKSTGQLSLITVFLTTMGSVVRVFTSLTDAADLKLAGSFALAAFLNFVLLVQIFVYWNSAPGKTHKQQANSKPQKQQQTNAKPLRESSGSHKEKGKKKD